MHYACRQELQQVPRHQAMNDFGGRMAPPLEPAIRPGADSDRFLSNHPFADQHGGVPMHGVKSTPAGIGEAAAQQTSGLMQVEFRFDFERHPIYSDCGNCLLNLFLRNCGPFEAIQPFLCLPHLGLTLMPAPGWMREDVSNVRKLLRFGPVDALKLPQHETVHCCTIAMPFSTAGGGIIRYAAESQHNFSALPDLRLTCICGSGNYPSEKVQFVVPATDLKTYFKRLSAAGEVPEFGENSAK